MTPVLDATKIENETELTPQEQLPDEQADEQLPDEQNEADNKLADDANADEGKTFSTTRSVTLAMPADCETSVTLLIANCSDNYIYAGYQVIRQYETSPHETETSVPPRNDGFETAEDALEDAAHQAIWWIEQNSGDGDAKAQSALDYLDKWRAELDAKVADGWVATDDTFDPIDEMEAASRAAQEHAAAAPCGFCTDELPETITATVASIKPTITDEAKRHFEEEKHRIESYIGRLSIEQARLKAAVKANREALSTYTEDLETLLNRGPEQLPLFDRKPQGEETNDNRTGDVTADRSEVCEAEPAAPAPAEAATEDPGSGDAWRQVTVEDLGIPPAICTLLREQNDIGTLGQIADHCLNYQLTDLKKIGKAKAEKIEAAMDAYWAKNPRQAESADGSVE